MAEPQRRIAHAASDSIDGSARASMAQQVTSVFLLTSDDELWIQLKDLAGDAYNIQQADSIEQTIELAKPGQAGVFIWDIRSAPQVNRGLTKLQHHSASLVPLVVDKDPASDVVAALLKQRAILGRLTLPLAEAQVSQALETSAEEANARATLFGSQGRSGSSAGTSGGMSGRLIGIIAVVVVALGAGIYWWMSRTPGAEHATAATTPTTAASPTPAAAAATAAKESQDAQVEPLLAKARLAMRDKRYDEPENDNALAYFRSVLVYDASNGEARQGLDRIAELLLLRASTAFEQRNYDDALRSIETARSIRPDHPRLAALDAQISQRRGELALAQIQAALQAQGYDRALQLIKDAQQSQSVPADVIVRLKGELARRQADSELSDTLKLLAARIQQGRLLDPAEDSAKFYLAAARRKANGANNGQLQSLTQDYGRALLQEARSAAQKQGDADRWISEARDAGVAGRDIASLQRELAQQAQRPKIDIGRTLQLVSDRISQERLSDPANDNALFYLTTLKAADPKNAALPDLTHRLAFEFLNAARTAVDDNRIADADVALQNARSLGAVATDVAAVDKRLAHSKALEAQRNSIVAAGRLTLTRAISPTYPDDALRTGTEGWVELLFTVDPEGKVADVEVVNSEPRSVFDRAAINAIKRARYEPVQVDGQAVAQRARFKITFRVDKK
ncbi:MAG: TonB family protein [Steroidobacteraceae bacterium]